MANQLKPKSRKALAKMLNANGGSPSRLAKKVKASKVSVSRMDERTWRKESD